MTKYVALVAVVGGWAGMFGCGGSGSDALGIAAECATNADCSDDGSLVCLANFSGGYCGLTGCTDNDGCPADGWCVAHTDGTNYCFRSCIDEAECNANRPTAKGANCSANFDRTDGVKGTKACIPPTS